MSGIDAKKSKRRKVKKGAVTKAASQNKSPSPAAPTIQDGEQTLKNLEKLMDAQDDDTLAMKIFPPRGLNPFLDRERCLLCNCERQDPPKAEKLINESGDKPIQDANPLSQLPLWVCPSCRKSADEEIHVDKKPSIEKFLEQDFDDTFLPDISIKSGSEPTTPNGTICSCDACTERRSIETEHEQETQELQQSWMELRKVVRCMYAVRQDEHGIPPPSDAARDLVHRLCSRDPHQLFLRLESQVKEFVIEMKVKLLKQLSAGFKTPPQAKKFISLLLEEYAHLCKVARQMADLLRDLQDHLKRFKVTWDLHNKHLFQSIVFSEPSIKNSINLLISQLRLGAASKESYNEDTYPNLLHEYLQFEDEMTVINVVWRDCHQLIESYNEEQSALKLKQKMLREDWEFFKTQRKLLEQQVSKNPKACLSHNLEAQFTETMRLMLQGNKPTQEELLCPRCNRKRCPCDECTITHMITCGIINPEVLENNNNNNSGATTSSHHTSFLNDPNRYRIDVSPPSMSSTTSSSGSSSPIMVDQERLPLPFKDNTPGDEIQEAESQSFDDEEDDDEDEDEEDDEEDEDADNEEETDAKEEEETDMNPFKGVVEISLPFTADEEAALRRGITGSETIGGIGVVDKLDTCNCDHCISQAKLEQVIKGDDNQCQCHVCLQQQGKAISTSLPQHVPMVPRPGELHLYPHIHGSTGLHGLGRGHVRPILQPNLYDLHLPSSQRHKSIIQQTKVPIKLDFDSPENINDHFYHAYGDWENNTYDPHQLLLGSGKFESELLPPPPFSTSYPSNLLSEPYFKVGAGVRTTSAASSLSSSTSSISSAFSSSLPLNHSSSAVSSVSQTSTKITDNLSVLTTKETLAEHVSKVSAKCPNSQGSPVKAHAPPCAARPVTIGGNNTPKVLDKPHTQHCFKHNPQNNAATKTGTLPNHNHTAGQHTVGQPKNSQELIQSKTNRVQQHTSTLKQPANHSCNHGNPRPPGHADGGGDTGQLVGGGMGVCPNSVQLPTTINNVSVGTSTLCTEPGCDGNHDDNYDSIDDNSSEQSSSTSNSTTQKEGKYCDCCYCEFFGHGNPPMAPTSKNYAEMRDKLRLRLKKKNECKSDEMLLNHRSVGSPGTCLAAAAPSPVRNKSVAKALSCVEDTPHEVADPLETKGLEELIKFINGTDDDLAGSKQQLSAKAAKRARQKQRKAEEKARQEAERLKAEQEAQERKRQAEIQEKLAAEAARKLAAEAAKNEGLTKKQKKKQAAKLAKSSSNSPTPCSSSSSGSSSTASVNGGVSSDSLQDKSSGNSGSKTQKKKGKHKDGDAKMLQVNITCEIEHNTDNGPTSAQKQQPKSFLNHYKETVNNTSSSSLSSQSQKTSAPNPFSIQQTPGSTSSPFIPVISPDIDNRNRVKVNKNRDPVKMSPVKGPQLSNVSKGDNVTDVKIPLLPPEQLAQITRQREELLNQQRQHLLQIRIQQQQQQQLESAAASMKNQTTLAQQQQQAKQAAGHAGLNKKMNVKIMHGSTASLSQKQAQSKGQSPQKQPSMVFEYAADPMKGIMGNNKTVINMSSPTAPRISEQNNNSTTKAAVTGNKGVQPQQNGTSNQRQSAPSPVASQGRKGRKAGDGSQQQNHVASSQQRPSPAASPIQNGSPGQTGPQGKGSGSERPSPQGQAKASGAATEDSRKQEQSKGKQKDSPPAGQGKTSGRNRRTKKKKGTDDSTFIDEVFMPKSESDIEDEHEREIEAFKRFCFDSSTPVKREKLSVNVNVKDIFSKRKTAVN